MFKELTKTQKRAIIALLIISPASGFGSITQAVLAYIQMSYPDVSITMVQQLLSLGNLVGLGVGLLVGALAIKISRRNLMIFGLLPTFLQFALYALVGPNGPFGLYILATVFYGICL